MSAADAAASGEKAAVRSCSLPGVDSITGRACILLDEHEGYCRVDPPLVGSTAWLDPWWADFAQVNPTERWAAGHARWVAENPEEWAEAVAYDASLCEHGDVPEECCKTPTAASSKQVEQ